MNEGHVRVPALTCSCGINPGTFVFNLNAPPEVLQKVFSMMRAMFDKNPTVCKGCGEAVRVGEVWLDELEKARNAWLAISPDYASLMRDLERYRRQRAAGSTAVH
jgi:protein gp37